MRSGFTLMEMMVSVTILAIIVSTAMETMVATGNVLTNSDSEYGLEIEARRALMTITEDMGNSSWYLPMDTDEKFYLLNPDVDRKIRYYPYVFTQTGDGQGDLFGHVERTDLIDLDTFEAIGLRVPNEHTFPSREIVFVKLARTEYVDDIDDTAMRHTSFENTPAVPFDEYWNGPTAHEMILELSGDNIVEINLNMEKNTSGEIREYSYGVRYNKSDNKHELCRYYVERTDNGQNSTTSKPVLDKVLSQYVDRIVVDTYRTNFSLAVDQVRVQLWLSRRGNDRTVTHKASMTFAMRSNVDPEYTQHIDAWLGTGGDYPVRE